MLLMRLQWLCFSCRDRNLYPVLWMAQQSATVVPGLFEEGSMAERLPTGEGDRLMRGFSPAMGHGSG
jgi:hypothetical protein